MTKFLVISLFLTLGTISEAAPLSNKLQPFTSDGCSGFPNGNWLHCCIRHDIAYWQGGTAEQRLEADKNLRRCVAEEAGEPEIATLMYLGVRIGGYRGYPTGWNWGYGWILQRTYSPLNVYEQEQVDELKKQIPPDFNQIPLVSTQVIRHRVSLTGDYCMDLAVQTIYDQVGGPFNIESTTEEITPVKAEGAFRKKLSVKVDGCQEPFEFSLYLMREKACTTPLNEFTARGWIRLNGVKTPKHCH